jgi:hypothetical protein
MLIIALALIIVITSTTYGKEVKAKNVMDAIQRGEPANFDGYTIKGDLDLSGSLEGYKDISVPISINNSTINGNVYFRNTIFLEQVVFSNSYINGIANFGGSQFNGTANFAKTKFNNISYFDSANFQQETHFEDSTFNCAVDFNRSQFNGDVYFGDYSNIRNGTKFKGKAYFELARFNRYASFMGSNFAGDADFWQSEFGDYVDFGEAEFHNTTSFNWATFKKQAFFSNSTFLGNADFYGSQFESDAMFDGTKFFGNLTLNWTRYRKLYIRWNSIENLISDDAGYMSLIKNFKDLGYFEDADDCYYRFRVEQFEHGYLNRTSPSRWIESLEQYLPDFLPASFDFLAMIFYGYGVKPLYPLIWSIGSIFLFGFIWMIGGLNASIGNQGIFERYGCNQMDCSENRPGCRDLWRMLHALLYAINFSIIVFLSGTKLFIDPPEIPKLQKLPKSLAKRVFVAERVLGAFFSILLFIAINSTVVRQIS